MEIPKGLSPAEEYFYIRRMQAKERKEPAIDYLMTLAEWLTKFDLTFPNIASPERAEKCVKRWLRDVSPGTWAIVGYERQDRGSVHIHGVSNILLDKQYAGNKWIAHAGFCRIAKIRNGRAAVAYAVKHAIKDGDFEIYSPGGISKLFTTGVQKRLQIITPNEYEKRAIEGLRPPAQLAVEAPRPR
jgi:hypothetical protein